MLGKAYGDAIALSCYHLSDLSAVNKGCSIDNYSFLGNGILAAEAKHRDHGEQARHFRTHAEWSASAVQG